MRNKTIYILLAVFFVGTFFSSCSSKQQEKKEVVDGILNLTDFDESELYAVDGNWEFYWNRLLNPKDFSSSKRARTFEVILQLEFSKWVA